MLLLDSEQSQKALEASVESFKDIKTHWHLEKCRFTQADRFDRYLGVLSLLQGQLCEAAFWLGRMTNCTKWRSRYRADSPKWALSPKNEGSFSPGIEAMCNLSCALLVMG